MLGVIPFQNDKNENENILFESYWNPHIIG